MPDTISLSKENPLLPAEDYAAMRKEGFKLIEQLGSDHWTDYNNADPGITILEAVLYAITDLAYRTGFEVKDLLAPEQLTEDTWKEIFYTARQILHNSALTITDYRKMMIDVKGVRNAWLEPSKEYEVPVWVDYNFFEKRKEQDCHCEDEEPQLCMGKLSLEAATAERTASFFASKQKEADAAHKKAIEAQTKLNESLDVINLQISEEKDPIAKFELQNSREQLRKKLERVGKKIGEAVADLKVIASMKYTASKIVELEGIYNVMIAYEEDVLLDDQREEVRQQVVQRLSRHRNLCEDFLTVQAVEYEDIGIGASISLEEYADPDTVLAKIFFIIYCYFTPSVPFYTIEQMLEKGYDIDEIFEGPALKHGFIEDGDIEKTSLFRDIRLSDIINEIMDIDGLKAITYFHLPFGGFDNDQAGKAYFNEWVKYLQAERKVARVVPEKSQIIFCKQRDMITYYTGSARDRRPNRMLKIFADWKVAERKYKLAGIDLDLPVPTGENMDLEDYYPVTYSLPMTYGVSDRAGLPVNADDKRKAQAWQLKGYMLFFEQLLSGHLSQLHHLRDLYTMDDSVTQTYYSRTFSERVLLEIKTDLQGLLIDHNNHGSDKFDQVLHDFSEVLQHLMETPQQFLLRRNTFMDHFLARFAEDRTEIDAINRWLVPYKVEERLVRDKTNILSNNEYYKVSTERGRGYNYARPDFWDTGNVSGTERRVGRLLGFGCVDRRNLAPQFLITEPVMVTNAQKQQQQKSDKKGRPLQVVKIKDPSNNESTLLTSVEVAEGCCTEMLLSDILLHADIRAHLKFHEDLNRRARKTAGPIGSFWFEIYDGPDGDAALLAGSERFDKKEARDKVYETLREVLDGLNDNEGMHLVEHLLLRPRLDEILDENSNSVPVSFLNICLDACDIGIGLDEGEFPGFRKRVSRTPAEKCFDKMPWVLEYLNIKNQSTLFREVIVGEDNYSALPLKFRRYEAMSQRIADIRQYGSERINYQLIPNIPPDSLTEDNIGLLRYSFVIKGDNDAILAQSLFAYTRRTPEQIAANNKKKDKIKDDVEDAIAAMMAWFGAEMDWYCQANPCDNNEDPYSFRTTAVLPCWPKRFRDATFRNLVKKTIATESPAHVHTRVVWLGVAEMKRFEEVYYSWLQEMSLTEIPSYEKVNPLVEVLNTLRPCGICDDDCGPSANEHKEETKATEGDNVKR